MLKINDTIAPDTTAMRTPHGVSLEFFSPARNGDQDMARTLPCLNGFSVDHRQAAGPIWWQEKIRELIWHHTEPIDFVSEGRPFAFW